MKKKRSSSHATTAGFEDTPKIGEEAAAWALRERSISRATLERLNVGSGTEFFGEVRSELDCIKFYYDDGGFKARAMGQKAFTSQSGMKANFWGLADVLSGALGAIYIVEGEFDRCALVEAGIPPDHVLAVSGSQMQEDPETGEMIFVGKLQYVKDALKAGLGEAKNFILCTDQDEAGLGLRTALANILGFAKAKFIDWPDGIKDANEYLIKDGMEALRDLALYGSVPWPAEGVYMMSEIADPEKLTCWHPGFIEWGNKMMLAPGMLSVVTGHPGHGKTQMWSQIWYQVMSANNLVACIATFETKPKPHYQRMIRQLYGRGLLHTLDAKQIAEADRWIEEHYRFIIHREERPTLEWLLNQAEIVIVRDGAKIVQIDPWNRLEASKEARENETDYIGRCLRTLYAFANDFNVHVQVLAHPSKMDGNRRGQMPALEDIAGSKHWENMVDQGFVVHRPKLFDDNGDRVTYAELHHLKARFDALGFPAKFGLDYDVDQGRYGSCPLAKKKDKSSKQEAQQAKPEDYDEF